MGAIGSGYVQGYQTTRKLIQDHEAQKQRVKLESDALKLKENLVKLQIQEFQRKAQEDQQKTLFRSLAMQEAMKEPETWSPYGGPGAESVAASGAPETMTTGGPNQSRLRAALIGAGMLPAEAITSMVGLEREKPMTVAPGATVYDPKRGPVFTAPNEQTTSITDPSQLRPASPGMRWAQTIDKEGKAAWREVAEPSQESNLQVRNRPDGSMVIVNPKTNESWVPSGPAGEPLKTAQPETEVYLSLVASGAIKDPKLPAQGAQSALNVLAKSKGMQAGERAEQIIRTRNELKDIVVAVTEAIAGGQAKGAKKGAFEASLDQPITPAEAIHYRMPAGTTRRELLDKNPTPITEADIDAGTQFQAAKAMLKEYKDISGRLLTATDAVGALGQRARLAYGAFVRTDEDAVRLRALQATVPLLVRALGEKGTLATMDVQRALNAVPDFGDTQQSAQAKITQLEKFIATVERNIKELRPGLSRATGLGVPGGQLTVDQGTQDLRKKYGY